MTDDLSALPPLLSREQQHILEEAIVKGMPSPAVVAQSSDPIADLVAAINLINAVPLERKEPIKLTRAQIDVLVDVNPPDVDNMPRWLVGVGHITGVRVVEVATVEESTPYAEGWL